MKRFFLISACLFLVVVFFQVSALADEETAYLDDSINIMMRSGMGVDFRIIAMLPLGQKITALEKEGEWVKIRTQGGTEGWVLKRFVGSEVPYRIRFDELQQEHAETLSRLSMMEQKNSLLVKDNRELKNRLETEVGQMSQQLDKLTWENRILRDAASNRFVKWFLAGAGVLFFGFIVGYLIKRGRRQSYFLS